MDKEIKSFSELTKEELVKTDNRDRCCTIAEFLGILIVGGNVEDNKIKIQTDNALVADRLVKLAKFLKTSPVVLKSSKASSRTTVSVECDAVLLDLINSFNIKMPADLFLKIPKELKEKECCRRAFVRGAFLGNGTMVNPEKTYNLEISLTNQSVFEELKNMLLIDNFIFKCTKRKTRFVLYLRKSEQIEDFLTYIGAFNSQMALINIKIEKELRNDMVRVINGENANFDKTIDASVKQIKAIEIIADSIGLDELPSELKEIAELRLKHKSLSMQELGSMLEKPLGKSGVNHRFKKIIALAESL